MSSTNKLQVNKLKTFEEIDKVEDNDLDYSNTEHKLQKITTSSPNESVESRKSFEEIVSIEENDFDYSTELPKMTSRSTPNQSKESGESSSKQSIIYVKLSENPSHSSSLENFVVGLEQRF